MTSWLSWHTIKRILNNLIKRSFLEAKQIWRWRRSCHSVDEDETEECEMDDGEINEHHLDLDKSDSEEREND